MALGDISLRTGSGHTNIATMSFPVAAAATTINAGEPVRISAAGSLDVVAVSDAYGTLATDLPFVGIAASTSTQTASVAGSVLVYVVQPGCELEMKVKTAGAIDTDAEITALRGSQRVLDLTSSTYSMDDATASATASMFVVTGGDSRSQRIFVMPKAKGLFVTCGTTTTTL